MVTPIRNRVLWTAVVDGVFTVCGAWAAFYAPPDMRPLIATTLIAIQGVAVAAIAAFTVENAVAANNVARVKIAEANVAAWAKRE